MKHYSVAIIGAGPAGLFASYYILNKSNKATVLLIDKGVETQKRICCSNCQLCPARERCNVLCGIGGSGLFSDGKLVLDLHSGGKLDAISSLTEEEKAELSKYIVTTLKKYDGVSKMGPHITFEQQQVWKRKFRQQGLSIHHYDVLHMGTENLQHITANFMNELLKNPRFTMKADCEIIDVRDGENEKSILFANNDEKFEAANVMFSIGKTGSKWLNNLFSREKIQFLNTKTYVGVRLEASHDLIAKLFEYSFDPKIWKYYGEQKVKTHCFCRHGDIICSNYMGFSVIGGQTRFTENNAVSNESISGKSNFNILVSTGADKDKILEILTEFKGLNPNGGVVQKLSDFLHLETKEINYHLNVPERYKWGNIRTVLDGLDNVGGLIADFIIRLSKIVPGVVHEDNLIYAPALEWFMDSVKVNQSMETTHKGWFAVGDGAGLSQGIVHAAATGIIAANEICLRVEEREC